MRIAAFIFLAVFLVVPVVLSAPAQREALKTNVPASAVKRPSAGPFRGKVVAVDAKARTIQVSKRTFLVASDAKIMRDGAPAKLEDAKPGEEVGGYQKPDAQGRLVATTLRLGPKPRTESPDSPGRN